MTVPRKQTATMMRRTMNSITMPLSRVAGHDQEAARGGGLRLRRQAVDGGCQPPQQGHQHALGQRHAELLLLQRQCL